MKRSKKSEGLDFLGELLASLNERYGLSDERGIHFITRNHGETNESAKKRHCEETGSIIGSDDIIFIEDFGGAAEISKPKSEIITEAPVNKDVKESSNELIPNKLFDFPKSGAFDKDKESLEQEPCRSPPEEEPHRHRIDRLLDETDMSDAEREELRKMGKIIKFPGPRHRGGPWGWMV